VIKYSNLLNRMLSRDEWIWHRLRLWQHPGRASSSSVLSVCHGCGASWTVLRHLPAPLPTQLPLSVEDDSHTRLYQHTPAPTQHKQASYGATCMSCT